MNKEQVVKHGEVIKWFCDNPEKGVWVYFSSKAGWRMTFNPNFDERNKFVQNDGYSELRKAQADGKVIQFKQSEDDWWANANSEFNLKVECYRIKPDETKFKVGDWVRTKTIPNKTFCISNIHDEAIYGVAHCRNESYPYTHVELWKPKEGEWCVFWNNEAKSYRVARFKMVGYGSGREGSYKDEQGNYFNNVAPRKFIDTLEDKQ